MGDITVTGDNVYNLSQPENGQPSERSKGLKFLALMSALILAGVAGGAMIPWLFSGGDSAPSDVVDSDTQNSYTIEKWTPE